jgi:hypothetical protein
MRGDGDDQWIRDVERRVDRFVAQSGAIYRKTQREQSAIFEMGCFFALIDEMERNGVPCEVEGLQDGEFRYLTSPSGKPENFSYVSFTFEGSRYELRSQVRVRSQIHQDVTFTPDLVLIRGKAKIDRVVDPEFAGGKRGVWAVHAKAVVAIYECKSLPGYPELYVSFLGMVSATRGRLVSRKHAAYRFESTLFVGGHARGFHRRMIAAIHEVCAVRIATGLHSGGWGLRRSPSGSV